MSIASLWKDRAAAGLQGPALSAYASRLIGADSRFVLWGGGNSSIKTVEHDHAGRETPVLWVKASGFDMKSITADGFAPLRLDDLSALRSREAMTDQEMVAYQMRCLLDPKAAKPSIETLLHAWVRAPHVYHTHADNVAGFTCTPRSQERTRRAFGDGVIWVPYVRPGFELAKLVAQAVEEAPGAWGLILDKHGALTWGQSAREAYEAMVRLVREAGRNVRVPGDKAELSRRRVSAQGRPAERRARALKLMPWLRGEISKDRRAILRWSEAPEVLSFLARPEGAALTQRGTFTMDHALQTKARPLVWRFGPRRSLARAMDGYRRWYGEHFHRHAPKGTPLMDPNPRVILVPGVGLFATGRDRCAAEAPEDIYRHTVQVIGRVASFTRYTPLDLKHLGAVEFWELETDKLKLAAPEKEFSRKVMFVTGAAGAIGFATARRFCRAGAHVVLADLDLKRCREREAELNREFGSEQAFAVALDVGDEASVARAFEQAVLRFGGLDILFSNAGIAKSAPIARLELKDWDANLRVNATGHFLCARAALRLFIEQGLGGSVVFNASKNVLAPGKEFAAYSASKAAQTQLARVLALEGAEHGVRANIVNPDAVFEGSGLWSPEVRRQRAKAQGIPVEELEDFYARRNLLKARVTAEDVAEAVMFFASDRSAKTTGAILPVDGGLREAFPR